MLLAEEAAVATILEAKGGREAVSAIRTKRPDLVFLDVQMPEMDGLAVVREIGADRMPAVVFVTAHDQYAIEAFELTAIDYLLKPVTKDRFALTLARARLRLQASDEAQRQVIALLETIAAPRRYLQRVAIRTAGKTSFVALDDVHWIQAAENYVELHAATGRQLLRVALAALEASLDPEIFLRIHRSLIVNARQIKELKPAFHGECGHPALGHTLAIEPHLPRADQPLGLQSLLTRCTPVLTDDPGHRPTNQWYGFRSAHSAPRRVPFRGVVRDARVPASTFENSQASVRTSRPRVLPSAQSWHGGDTVHPGEPAPLLLNPAI